MQVLEAAPGTLGVHVVAQAAAAVADGASQDRLDRLRETRDLVGPQSVSATQRMEARGPDRSDFGNNRMIEVIRRECDKPAKDIVDAIYRAARAFADDQPQKDDITVLLGKVL